MTDDQTRREIEAAKTRGVELRIFNLSPPADINFWDYARVEELIETGRQQMRDELAREPLRIVPSWQLRFRKSLAGTIHKAFKP